MRRKIIKNHIDFVHVHQRKLPPPKNAMILIYYIPEWGLQTKQLHLSMFSNFVFPPSFYSSYAHILTSQMPHLMFSLRLTYRVRSLYLGRS